MTVILRAAYIEMNLAFLKKRLFLHKICRLYDIKYIDLIRICIDFLIWLFNEMLEE